MWKKLTEDCSLDFINNLLVIWFKLTRHRQMVWCSQSWSTSKTTVFSIRHIRVVPSSSKRWFIEVITVTSYQCFPVCDKFEKIWRLWERKLKGNIIWDFLFWGLFFQPTPLFRSICKQTSCIFYIYCLCHDFVPISLLHEIRELSVCF